jgi:ribonuclease D
VADPAALAERAREGGRLGIDTEFMAEGRYQALLCLVQVAVPTGSSDEVEVAVLDPLADGSFDHEPLAEVLADPDI